MKNKYYRVVDHILMKYVKNFIMLKINTFKIMSKKICKVLKVHNKMITISLPIYKIYL